MSNRTTELLSGVRELLQVPAGQVDAPVALDGNIASNKMCLNLSLAVSDRLARQAPTPAELQEARDMSGYLADEFGVHNFSRVYLGNRQWLSQHQSGVARAVSRLAVGLDRGYRAGLLDVDMDDLDTGDYVHYAAAEYLATATISADEVLGYMSWTGRISITAART